MLYLGRWRWRTSPFPHWAPPIGTTACLDLRSPAQCAQAAVAAGFGLFEIPGTPVEGGLEVFGADMEDTPPDAIKDRIAQRLGIAKVPAWVRCGDIIWELFTLRPDVTGVNRWCPLMPETKGRLRLILGAWQREKPFAVGEVEEWAAVRDMLHLQYRKVRQACLDGKMPGRHYLKLLDYWCEKYRTKDWQLFVPDDLPKEEPIRHDTTITESFNTSDGDTLGPDLSWTELEGDIDIVSNKAQHSTANFDHSVARADTDLSSEDHYAQADVLSSVDGSLPGLIVRKDASATMTYYLLQVWAGTSFFKRIGGTYTLIGDELTDIIATGVEHTAKFDVNGSTLTAFIDGVQYGGSRSDTSITAGLRTGIQGYRGAGGTLTWDNFEASDGVAGGGTPYTAELTVASFGFTPQAPMYAANWVGMLTAASFAISAQALAYVSGLFFTLTAASFGFTAQALTRVNNWIGQLTAPAFGLTPQGLTRMNDWQALLSSPAFQLAGKSLTFITGLLFTLSAPAFSFMGRQLTWVQSWVGSLSAPAFNFTAQAITQATGWLGILSTAAFSFTANAVNRISEYAGQLTAATFKVAPQFLTWTHSAVEEVRRRTGQMLRRWRGGRRGRY